MQLQRDNSLYHKYGIIEKPTREFRLVLPVRSEWRPPRVPAPAGPALPLPPGRELAHLQQDRLQGRRRPEPGRPQHVPLQVSHGDCVNVDRIWKYLMMVMIRTYWKHWKHFVTCCIISPLLPSIKSQSLPVSSGSRRPGSTRTLVAVVGSGATTTLPGWFVPRTGAV